MGAGNRRDVAGPLGLCCSPATVTTAPSLCDDAACISDSGWRQLLPAPRLRRPCQRLAVIPASEGLTDWRALRGSAPPPRGDGRALRGMPPTWRRAALLPRPVSRRQKWARLGGCQSEGGGQSRRRGQTTAAVNGTGAAKARAAVKGAPLV